MTYFKMIQDSKIVDVGFVFLKWNTKRNKLYVCDIDEGQFIQSYNEKTIYKTSWLKPSPEGVCEYETATIVVINETEFEDLKELLSGGESVEVEDVIPVPIKHEVYLESEKEKPLSLDQMRELIAEQQNQIELLMEKIK